MLIVYPFTNAKNRLTTYPLQIADLLFFFSFSVADRGKMQTWSMETLPPPPVGARPPTR